MFSDHLGEFASLGTAVLWAICSLLFTLGSKRIGASVVNMTRLAIALVFICGYHHYRFGSAIPWDTEPWRWGILALSSILGLVIGDGALFFAFMRIGPQRSMLVMTLVPIISAFFAWLCFGELILPIEFVGVLVTVVAIGWVVSEKRPRVPPPVLRPTQTTVAAVTRSSLDSPASNTANPYRVNSVDEPGLTAGSDSDDGGESESRNFWIGVGLAFVGALGQTANLVITKYALVDGYSELSATLGRILVAVVWLLIWTIITGQLIPTIKRYKDVRALVYVAAGAFVGPFLGIWLSYIAIRETRIGVAATIMATPPLLLLPLSAVFLNERVTKRALIGTTLAVVGVSLLFLK